MNCPTLFENLSDVQRARVREMRKLANYTYHKSTWSVDKTFYWNILVWNDVKI